MDRNFVIEDISKNVQHGNLKTRKHILLDKSNQGEWHAFVGFKYCLVVIAFLTFSIFSSQAFTSFI
jgi:hypothetical protein